MPHGYQIIRSGFRRAAVNLLAVYFRIVPVPQSLLDAKEELDGLCIVTESGSVVIAGLLRSFAKRIGLKDAVDLGMHPDAQRTPERLYWCSLHARSSLEQLLSSQQPPRLATLNIFSGRGPFKNNPYYKLGFWDLSGILILGKFLIIFLGHPIDPAATGVSFVTRALRIDLYKNLKLVRGTPFQTIETQARVVVGGSEFMQELSQLADKLSVSATTLHKRARRAFYEIAANPRRPMYRIVAFLARHIISRLFSSVRTSGLDSLKQAVRSSTVVLVPMHRSHLDYILIGSELYQANFNPPLVAAGMNLSFWPAGLLIRSVGTYFVKRDVRSDRLHALILKRYVGYLVKRGHLQEFFIEGGRSRSGRMRPPKVGLLNILFDAHLKGYKRDIVFVPVSITYENVIEDYTYGHENTGRGKIKESFWSLLKAGSIFRGRYGDVVINFGEAISLQKFAEGSGIDKPQGRQAVSECALEITRAIRDQTNPSLTSLLHTALVAAPRYGLRKSDLILATKNLGRLLSFVKEHQPSMGDYTPALKHFLYGNETLLADFSRSKTISVKPCLGEDVFIIPGERRYTADFYKNATIHFFLSAGIFSILDLLGLDLNRENIREFYLVFEHDYILGDEEQFINMCEKLRDSLLKAEILKTDDGKRSFAAREMGLFIPSLLLPSIQALLWAATVLLEYNEEIDYDHALDRMLTEFRAAVYLGRVSSTEASSSAALNSALTTLQALGAISIGDRLGKNKRIKIKDPSFHSLEILRKANAAILRWQSEEMGRA